MIEFKFHFRNCTEGTLSHQWKTFLSSCPFEDKPLEACFSRDDVEEDELAKASLKQVGGREAHGAMRGTPISLCACFPPSFWLQGDFCEEESML